MSTRSRILLALLALTLLPLLGVGVWACVHAVRWSPDAVQLRLGRAAFAAATDVRTRHDDARQALQQLGDMLLPEDAGVVPDAATVASALNWWPGADHFDHIEVRGPAGEVLHRTAVQPARQAEACGPAEVVFTAQAGEGARRIELTGRVAAERIHSPGEVSPDAARLAVVDGDGRPVVDPLCLAAAGLLPVGVAVPRTPSAWGVELPGSGWSVVAVPGPGWPAPFPQSGLYLVLIAVFVATAAAGAFLIIMRDLLRSLDVLTSAAVRIGGGDFSPWLPPPAHDEVGRLSFAIGTMAARIEQVMQQNARNRQMAAIGELASHVSHEIRNPLSSIKLNLQSIEREIRSGAVPIDLHEVMQLCLREVNRLDGTVQGVLRLAGSREPQFAAVSLHTVLRDAIQTVAPQLEERDIMLQVRLDAMRDGVRADASQLRGVFINLLVNGRDAMPDGGRLRVWSELTDDAGRGHTIRVHVADDGPGVRPEDRDRIFQPFYTTKSTGSGIGLPLASRIVETHGGRLWLERRSELEQGAEFVIEIPLAAGAGTEHSRRGAAGAEGRRIARWSRTRNAPPAPREEAG